LGILFYDIKETEKAINCFEKVLTIDPKNKEVNYNLGRIYQGIGNQMRAVENYQKTLINRSEINFEIDQEKDQKLDPATVFFFLELTNKCNFHCEFCPSDSQTRLHGYMELSLVKKIFDEISQKKIVPQVALHLMGEPTLHPKLNEILVYARSKNVKIALTTNGSTLVKKKVPKLLESISGKIVASLMTPTKKTYKIRGDVRLSWDRYIDNFRLLIQEHLKKISRDDKIEYQIIIRIMVTGKAMEGATKVLESSTDIQESYNEWSNFVETTEKELGLKPFTRQKIDSTKTFSILSEYEEMSYNLQKGIKIQFWRAFTFANSRVRDEYKLLPQEKTQYCPHPFTDFGVLWNGDVSLCCLDYDGTLKVGNVKNHSVEDVLKSIDSKKLRASMYGLEKLHPTCQKCQSRPVEK
jgi:radical SAM protein with 4Fe4S-binding SPASM domain